ncbi:Uncharacterized urease accessory protein ureD-like [Taphrina deformans PYCC 5710]|uniref:Uncharacterized urease accessory protein ureD-like n=1 Tax=Taphrina deformans (strain PYCC 5710 / ATCC 11124 / CBS 356.35 / IMI 108563 / JCM 9778 / NBRC 8474) TaxID=1097556 RepID=R4XH43_TAPDE|nr:Uncharacterized urease accessory protein ureD-like [Taphrina deformans PYCC 5710]|eukprot:CCG85168.1 Uncharacterized urease accessory protein ureD-like [Taphrina deformans PYCC 5710]
MEGANLKGAQNITQHIGTGSIRLELARGNLHLSDLAFTYPLKLVAPKASPKSQSVFLLSYGGGLVGGDAIALSVVLEPNTTIALMTQGSTKIFKKRPGLPATQQTMEVELQAGATCLLIPDPVQPFAGSAYTQRQSFTLHDESNLILLDWVVSGRPANGEIWDFLEFTSTNSIYAHDANQPSHATGRRLISRDAQIMCFPETKKQMSKYNCMATMLFVGPATAGASRTLLTRFKHEERIRGHSGSRIHQSDPGMVQWTVTSHRTVTILKVVGESSEQVKEFLNATVDDVGWRSQYGREPFRALE